MALQTRRPKALLDESQHFTSPAFEEDEAESIVKEVRCYIRKAETAYANEDESGALSAETLAEISFNKLEGRLRWRFEGKARHCFPQDTATAEDVIVEMYKLLWIRITNVSGAYMAFENVFNYAVDKLMVDAIRTVGGENGRDRQGILKVNVSSLDEPISGEWATEQLTLDEVLPDEEAQKKMDSILGEDLTRDLLRQIQDPVYIRIFVDRHLSSLPWKEIAERTGMSVSKAQYICKRSVQILFDVVTEYQKEDLL